MSIVEIDGACPSSIESDRFFIHTLTGLVSDKYTGGSKMNYASMDISGKCAAGYIKREV